MCVMRVLFLKGMYAFFGFVISIATVFSYPNLDLSWVESWGLQLQDSDVEELRASPYDLLVIDYSKDGTDETAYSKEDINIARNQGSKIILAYLSIGEVEDYRFYWKNDWEVGNPSFIGDENPNWPGNYKVKYWEKTWWKLVIRPYLNKIINAGFNGVYLDIVDAYWYWGEMDGNHKEHAIQMFKLIKKIKRYANRKTGGNFAVCPQNGLSILDDLPAKKKKKYLELIGCVGVESVFYNVWSEEDKAYRLDLLGEVDQANKPIFSVEYISPDQHLEYENEWLNHPYRFIGYPSAPDQALDKLTEL
ncbi:endo alpha-1,4 polygalactosaminidase [Francisellaceae bacterium]|nr:endo alpha-1,4 polygalactosaminidase [Francisellaceae bacterium]